MNWIDICQLQCDYLSEGTSNKNLCSRSCHSDGLLRSHWKKIRQINSNGIWLTLQNSSSVRKSEKRDDEKNATKRKRLFLPFIRSSGRARLCCFHRRSTRTTNTLGPFAFWFRTFVKAQIPWTIWRTITQNEKPARKSFYIIFLQCRLLYKLYNVECRCDRNGDKPQI